MMNGQLTKFLVTRYDGRPEHSVGWAAGEPRIDFAVTRKCSSCYSEMSRMLERLALHFPQKGYKFVFAVTTHTSGERIQS